MAVGGLVPPDAAYVATVYTNGPKRHRGAILANLCTLLRPHACPQRRNSVHECPKMAPRGRFRQSVYTPASPRPLARPGGATGLTRRRPSCSQTAGVEDARLSWAKTPSLAPQSCKAQDWGVWSVIQLSNEFATRVAVTHAASATRGQPPHRLSLSDRRAQPPLRWEG